ncbi:MAG TPA: molybdopterin-dependent oxidoreductase [Thermodesulfobacteriota bacterium]|nr:molybdopterin-dependent oxidoreductase [Thermodesulfobacteriota bacterium]
MSGDAASTVRGWCGPCHVRCGKLLEMKDGKAISVRGDKNHPMSRGFQCHRGMTNIEHLYNKDRLNFPLKRDGERGSNAWKRISWNEALDEIADRLGALRDAHGPETLAFFHGTYRTYGWPLKRFFNVFGSPNICGNQSICRCPSWTVEYATCGSALSPDWGPNARLVVLFGAHLQESVLPAWQGLKEGKKHGLKLIVVDPMKNAEADLADIWLPVRPGTDVMLMLSWIKIIIDEKLYDQDFVNNWCYGFDKLAEAVKNHSHDEAARITGISKDLIFSSGQMCAHAPATIFSWGLGIDRQGVNAQQASRARVILQAITGNLDRKGGQFVGKDSKAIITDYEMELNEKLSSGQRKKQLGSDTYKLMAYPGWELIEKAVTKLPSEYAHPPVAEFGASAHAPAVLNAMLTGKPYPVKAAFFQASNPMVTLPNPKRTCEALCKADLVVVDDYYMTPTAALADFVLPAAGTLERSDIADHYGFESWAIACPKALEPLYERKDDYYLWKELGMRLGQKEHWPWQTMEEALDYRTKPLGISFAELTDRYWINSERKYEKYKKYGFATPTGKIELYSTIFEQLGIDPLPVYKELPESLLSDPTIVKEYPFILLTGTRFMPMYHSELRQIKSARRLRPDPRMMINPVDAKEQGIVDGAWVIVENSHGSARFKAIVTNRVQEKMISVEHGWWFPEKEAKLPSLYGVFESNSNSLCPDNEEYCSKEIGTWPYSALLCRVRKA